MSRSRGVLVLLCLAVASSLAAGAPAHAGSGGRHPFGTPMRNYLAGRQSRVGAALLDLDSGQLWQYHPLRQFDTGSVVKVQILGALLHRAKVEHRLLTSWERNNAARMIENSDNDSATRLWNSLGAESGIAEFDQEAGLTHTSPQYHWGLTLTTAPDQVHLVKTLVKRSALYGKRAAYGLHLMENVESDQRWGVSAGARNESGTTIALKNGWLPETDERQWIINSVGWISGNGRNYVLAVLTDENPSMTYGVDTIEGVARIVWNDLG